ncbi:hypothetical protein ACQPW1_10135 [Nocardia sp. CA-128927]|uniref:hypothetical protein n=1 Tax=Nocardia sp. CA-128927 TaxID=3239975 RepID=UPI003D97DE15
MGVNIPYTLEMIPDPPAGEERGTALHVGTLEDCVDRLIAAAEASRNADLSWLNEYSFRAELPNGYHIFRVSQVQKDVETLFPQTISAPPATEERGEP